MRYTSIAIRIAAGVLALGLFSATVGASAQAPSDTWSKASLTTTYALNPHLNPFSINVDVQNGAATLSGTVDSEVDRDLAEELALGVDGIRQVVNRLQVAPQASADMEQQKLGQQQRGFLRKVEDANISAKVKSQLLWNDSTSGLDIDVDTKNGIVSLSGSVTSGAEADLAEQIARNTTDVLGVDNRLQIDPDKAGLAERVSREGRAVQQQVGDAWISAKVKSALLYNRNVHGNAINVDTRNGVVTLKGIVNSRFEKEQALSVARTIQGVRQVKDQLKSGV